MGSLGGLWGHRMTYGVIGWPMGSLGGLWGHRVPLPPGHGLLHGHRGGLRPRGAAGHRHGELGGGLWGFGGDYGVIGCLMGPWRSLWGHWVSYGVIGCPMGPWRSLWGPGGLKGVLEDSMGHCMSYGVIGCPMWS